MGIMANSLLVLIGKNTEKKNKYDAKQCGLYHDDANEDPGRRQHQQHLSVCESTKHRHVTKYLALSKPLPASTIGSK